MLFILSKFFNLYQIKLIVYLFFYIINRMQINQTSFICKYDNCNKYFKEPVILTCGFSICREHIDDLVKNNIQNFKCNSCQHDHSSTQNYILNMTLKHLITEENSHLKGNLLEMRKLLDSFEQTLNEIDKIQQDPANYLYEYVNEQKRKIELQREELKLQIDKNAEDLIKKIDELNSQFSAKLDNIDLEEYKKTAENYEENHMRNPNLHKNDFNELISKLENINKQAESNLNNIKRKLRNEKTVEFEPNSKKFKTSNFGSLAIRPDVQLKKKAELEGQVSEITVAINYPDNKLITGSDDETIKIWDLNTKQCLQTIKYDQNGLIINLFLFEDNSKLIALVQDEEDDETHRIKIFCMHTFYMIGRIKEHLDCFFGACLLPNNRLMTSDLDYVQTWDLNTRKSISKHKNKFCYENINILNQNKLICSTFGNNQRSSLLIFEIETNRILIIFGDCPAQINCLKLFSNNQKALTAHDDGIRIWDLEKNQLAKKICSKNSIYSIDLIQNETYLIAKSFPNLYLYNFNNESEFHISEKINDVNDSFELNVLLPNEDIIGINNGIISIYENLFKNLKEN